MLFLRSLLFVSLHLLTAVFFGMLSIFLWMLPFRWRYSVISQWAKSNLWLLEKICRISFKVEGLENIPDTACVILCKHQSSWETLALQAVFPPQVWVLKRELLWIPFFGWGLAALEPIAIDRRAGRKALNQVISQGRDRLGKGAWVVIFPEGTRISAGEMGRFGIGGARLAVDTGYPIVPVAHNAGYFWPKHGFLKRPGVITMVVGSVLPTEELSAADANQKVYDWMQQEMIRLDKEAENNNQGESE